MSGLPQPTQWALRKASDLGKAMAAADRRIQPILDHAHEYLTYIQFMQAHRHRLEQLSAIQPWDEHLQRLIEQEEKMLGCEFFETERWDVLHTRIATPMRCAFWYGWESAVRLRDQYDKACALARQQQHQMQVVRAATSDAPEITQAQLTEEQEEIGWQQLAQQLFAPVNQQASTPPAADQTGPREGSGLLASTK